MKFPTLLSATRLFIVYIPSDWIFSQHFTSDNVFNQQVELIYSRSILRATILQFLDNSENAWPALRRLGRAVQSYPRELFRLGLDEVPSKIRINKILENTRLCGKSH